MLKLVIAALAAAPLFAGGFTLDVQPGPSSSTVTAAIRSCATPEKSVVTATAVQGNRTIPLKVDHFAVDLPKEGAWTVKVVGTHPEYGDYASRVQVQVVNGSPDWSTVRRY